MKAVYVHVPFCRDICAYCDFTRCRYHAGLADQWLIAVKRELQGKACAGFGRNSVYRRWNPECIKQQTAGAAAEAARPIYDTGTGIYGGSECGITG